MTCPTCGFDDGPIGVNEAGDPLVCLDPFHVPRTYWEFGTIIRVDPATSPKVPQPDDRRWMVLVPANTSATRQWTFLSLTGSMPSISHWSSSYGFVLVDE